MKFSLLAMVWCCLNSQGCYIWKMISRFYLIMINFKCKYLHKTSDWQFSFSFLSTRFFCCLISGKLYRMKLDDTGHRRCSRHTQRSSGRLFCPASFRKLFLWHKRTARGCVYTYRGWCVVPESVLFQGLPRWASGWECLLLTEHEDMSSVQMETKKASQLRYREGRQQCERGDMNPEGEIFWKEKCRRLPKPIFTTSQGTRDRRCQSQAPTRLTLRPAVANSSGWEVTTVRIFLLSWAHNGTFECWLETLLSWNYSLYCLGAFIVFWQFYQRTFIFPRGLYQFDLHFCHLICIN